MERFVHNENIEHYRRLIAESEFDPSRDEGRHKMLLTHLNVSADECLFLRVASGAAWDPPKRSGRLVLKSETTKRPLESGGPESPRPDDATLAASHRSIVPNT